MSSLCSRRPSSTLLLISAGSSAARKARTSARKASSAAVKLRSMRFSGGSFDHHHDLAERRAGGEPRDRRGALGEREALGDHRPHAAGAVKCHEGRDVGCVFLGEAPRELAPEYPDDVAALEER